MGTTANDYKKRQRNDGNAGGDVQHQLCLKHANLKVIWVCRESKNFGEGKKITVISGTTREELDPQPKRVYPLTVIHSKWSTTKHKRSCRELEEILEHP